MALVVAQVAVLQYRVQARLRPRLLRAQLRKAERPRPVRPSVVQADAGVAALAAVRLSPMQRKSAR